MDLGCWIRVRRSRSTRCRRWRSSRERTSPPAPRSEFYRETDGRHVVGTISAELKLFVLPVFWQFALRLLAFRQIHKVLGMDPLPQMNPRFNVRNSRKRRRDNSDGNDSFEGEGKKDKKDYDSF